MRLMQKAIGEGWRLRVVGSAISPNGLGFASDCMISMAHLDRVLNVDADKMQVRLPAVLRPTHLSVLDEVAASGCSHVWCPVRVTKGKVCCVCAHPQIPSWLAEPPLSHQMCVMCTCHAGESAGRGQGAGRGGGAAPAWPNPAELRICAGAADRRLHAGVAAFLAPMSCDAACAASGLLWVVAARVMAAVGSSATAAAQMHSSSSLVSDPQAPMVLAAQAGNALYDTATHTRSNNEHPSASVPMQVSAHGTGAKLPPVDEQVVALRIASPGSGGAVEMRRGEDAAFPWACVGLGSMGVVTELTLQCVPAHRLAEDTFVASHKEVRQKHKQCALAASVNMHCQLSGSL